MTDQQDRRTEHGLRSPANDGAPRPKPPSGINTACNAARRQGELDGLRKAARAVCHKCDKPNDPAIHNEFTGEWSHHKWRPLEIRAPILCPANNIHNLIAKGWGTTKPEGKRK